MGRVWLDGWSESAAFDADRTSANLDDCLGHRAHERHVLYDVRHGVSVNLQSTSGSRKDDEFRSAGEWFPLTRTRGPSHHAAL